MGHIHENFPEVVTNNQSYLEAYNQNTRVVGHGEIQSVHEQQDA